MDIKKNATEMQLECTFNAPLMCCKVYIKEDIHMYFKMYINSTSCNYEMYHICTLKVSEMYIVVY